MTFEETFRYSLVGLTSGAIFVFAIRVLGLQSRVLITTMRELAQCVGASVIFFLVNVTIGVSVVFLIRWFGKFVPLYAMANWSLLLFSLVQGFLFQMWWRRSKAQFSTRKSATSGRWSEASSAEPRR